MEFFAVDEGVVEPFDDIALLLGEFVGIVGVDGREVATCHFVFFAVDGAYSALVVDGFQ
jgi:hypothetical protein